MSTSQQWAPDAVGVYIGGIDRFAQLTGQRPDGDGRSSQALAKNHASGTNNHRNHRLANPKQSKHGLLLLHRFCLISSPLIGVGYEITNNELPRVCGREPSHLAMAKNTMLKRLDSIFSLQKQGVPGCKWN